MVDPSMLVWKNYVEMLYMYLQCEYDLALSLDPSLGDWCDREGWDLEVGTCKQHAPQHVGTQQRMYEQMDKWRGKDEAFVRDAETNDCFYPKAGGEESDGTARDTHNLIVAG